jgi:iron complex outermembrane receptor protein
MSLKIRYAVVLACASALPLSTWAAEEESTGGLEEIVITAQKRTEKLSDVPVSASVLSTETMANINAGDISDLNRLVPSVMLSGSINGRVPTGMRGISSVSNEATIGLSSGVAIMIDGVPVPSDSRAGNNLDDAAGVEVLKGPQATLGGRTAAAGVINVVTRRPSDVFTGDISLTATDDDEYRVNGYIAGPISDSVQYSLAAYYTDRDYPIKNLIRDENTNQQIYGARGKLLFKPTENLDITLMARYGRDDSTGANFVYVHTTPGAYLLLGTDLPPFGIPPDFPREFLQSVLSQEVVLPGITPGWDNQSYTSPVQASSKVKDTDYSLDIQYQLGDLALGSTTAYQKETQVNNQDLFLTDTFWWNNLTAFPPPAPPQFFNIQTTELDIKQLSQELKLASSTDRDFSYLVGFFFSDTDVSMLYNRPFVPAWQSTDTTSETKTTDVYARGTWRFTPSNSLVAGLRYNYDQLAYDYTKIVFPPPPVTQPISYGESTSESSVVGDLSLQHKFGNGTMAYLTYARGYSPGAYNTAYVQYAGEAAANNDPSLGMAKKMDIGHFELGTKGMYLDGRLSVNAAAFYTKYKDFQVQIFDSSTASLAPPLQLANAGGAETKGIEIDLQFAATDMLRLGLNAAYVEAEFTEYLGAPCYADVSAFVPAGSTCFQDVPDANGEINGVRDAGEPGPGDPMLPDVDDFDNDGNVTEPAPYVVVQDLSGKPMPLSPKFKFVLSADQRIPLSAGGDILLGANYSWRDKAQMLVDQNPYGIQDSFGILNLSVGWESDSGKLSATVFCNNVLDEHYFTDIQDFWSAPWGNTNTIIGQPARDTNRYFGLRVSAGF